MHENKKLKKLLALTLVASVPLGTLNMAVAEGEPSPTVTAPTESVAPTAVPEQTAVPAVTE